VLGFFFPVLLPYHKTIAEDSHVSAALTGARKVMGTCYILVILTEITHTRHALSFVITYIQRAFMIFLSL
jgi:hypothetical protein